MSYSTFGEQILKRLVASCALGAVLMSSPALAQTVLFSEDFEGLTLGENVDEGDLADDAQEAVYSATGPEGWNVDRSQVPDGGVLEFRGWNFLDPAWWESVAGQDRGGFVPVGEGVIAVADGDEWDDAPNAGGTMNTFLTTPLIPVSSGDVELTFDTSWRPDGTQEAQVRALFDVGEPVELLHWFSSEEVGGPPSEDGLFGFRSDPLADGFPADEIVDATIPVPAGASTVQLEFGYLNAGNHWWWAVDNISVGDDYFEDFEFVELGPNLEEDRLPENLRGDLTSVWTEEPPEGWEIDDSGVPGSGDEANDGVTEWAGWSFANKDWWTAVAGDQRRSEFDSGEGNVLIADPDEWDDQPHLDSEENGWFQTTIDTPEISLEGVEGEIEIEFDSGWRPEFDSNFRQSGRLVATFDDGTEAELFEWRSADGNVTEEFLGGSDELANTFANGDKINDEDLTFSVEVPDGAASVSFQFEMFDAGNDWWWAIDNVRVLAGGEAPVGLVGDIDMDGAVQFSDFLILSTSFGMDVEAGTNGDIDGDGSVAFSDFLLLSDNFGATAAATSVPEPSAFLLGGFGLLTLMLRRRRRA